MEGWAIVSTLLVVSLLAWFVTCKSTRIVFYSPEKARHLFGSNSVRKLVSTYKPMECSARSSGRAYTPEWMLQQYMQFVRRFSINEMTRLQSIVEHSPRLRARTWKFVKLDDSMDFGFPYTLNDVVVLPSSFLAQHDEREAAVTLLHESFHIDQRANQPRFDSFYKRQWGYVRPKRLTVPEGIWKHTVTDPDAPDIRWVRQMNGAYWWTALVLPNEKSHPIAVAYMCKQTRPGHFVVTNEKRPLTSFKACLFGETDAYHPNELFATVYSRRSVEPSL